MRVPRTIYKDKLVLDFFSIKNEIHYKLSRWSEDGTNLAVIEIDKLGDKKPQNILALQLVGDGIRQ